MTPRGKQKGFKRGRTGLVGCKGARRGLGPAALCDAGTRLWLGLCAAGSASLALQVPVTHNHSRPPLALAHSLPRHHRRRRAGQTHQRAPTQGAENQPCGTRGQRRRAGGGEARDPENSTHSHPMRPGDPAPTPQQPWAPRWAAATKRARRGRSELGGDWSPGKAQTRALPALFLSLLPQPDALLSLQGDVPDTQRSAKDVPKASPKAQATSSAWYRPAHWPRLPA